MAVIDLFYLNNELDLLEVRLNILGSFVDKFVIVEAPLTFSGVPKPLYYLENKERFAKWSDKIVHCVVEEGDKEIMKQAYLSPNTGNGEDYWLREFYQKEYAKKALTFCKDYDLVFISDVDEIWNPLFRKFIDFKSVYKPKQLPYLYYFNQRTDEDWLGWTGTIFTRYKVIKDSCINHLRTDSMTDYIVIENSGWHFNSIGGKEQKKEAFKHPVYENESEWKRREVNLHIDESDLPKYLINNKEVWKRLFL